MNAIYIVRITIKLSSNHSTMKLSKHQRNCCRKFRGVLAGMIAADVTDEQLAKFATYSNYFNPNRNIVDHELVEGVHRSGLKIYVYTVRAQEQADKLFATGVDGIISDFPEYVHDFPGQK